MGKLNYSAVCSIGFGYIFFGSDELTMWCSIEKDQRRQGWPRRFQGPGRSHCLATLPKLQRQSRDADKVQKKRMAPGSGSKAAARDPTLEIDLTGKGLTDDGFAEFIDDLISCINCRDAEHPLGLAKVTELHLQSNKLTVQSLLKLGDVIASSGGDLRELDLSRNDIRIVTEEEKTIWKLFLGSFKNCYMLKKLDLAGNPIGTAGLEILARGYIKSDLDFLEADAEAIVSQDHGFSTDVEDGEEAALEEETAALKIDVKASSDCKSGCAKKSPSKVGRAARQNGMDIPLIQLVIIAL